VHTFAAVIPGRSVEDKQQAYSSRPAGWLQQRKACAINSINSTGLAAA